MKQLSLYLTSLIVVLLMAACGGDDSKEDAVTYTKTETLSANGGEQIVTLSDLSTSIEAIDNSSSWLVASPLYYSSGAPKLQLNVSENKDQQERRCIVTVTAVSGDKVILTVIQQAAEEIKDGIDDIHGETTSNPAYAPRY